MSTRSNTEGLVYSGSLTDPAFFPERMAQRLFTGAPIPAEMASQLVTDGAFRTQVADHLDRRQRRAQAITQVQRIMLAAVDEAIVEIEAPIEFNPKQTAESIVDLLCPDLAVSIREV